ncbi:hypothetical protein N1031_04545 [Herbiconiux moechotypicola]|uniref:Uncharacterized protein n=1 Tax=Herbiconiux moechotypicola TaxID=637393 RepID=A0ABN3D9T4_9MICO|nr:hypothetical protein [Herbiconiux moechotypicola]MCS5729020.1 hypothetical protein [Herbiconiux moechotypicola]
MPEEIAVPSGIVVPADEQPLVQAAVDEHVHRWQLLRELIEAGA